MRFDELNGVEDLTMKARQTMRFVMIIGFLTWQAQGADGRASKEKPVPTSIPTVVAPVMEDSNGAGKEAGGLGNSLDRSIGSMVDLITGTKAEVDRAINPAQKMHKPIDRDPALGPAASGRAPAVIDDELAINPTGSNINGEMSPKGKVEDWGTVKNASATGDRTLGQ